MFEDVPALDNAARGLDLEAGGSCAAQAELEHSLRSHCICLISPSSRDQKVWSCLYQIVVMSSSGILPPTPEVHGLPIKSLAYQTALLGRARAYP